MKIRFFSLFLALASTALIAGCGGDPPASDLAAAKGALDAARAAGAEKFAASDYSAAQGAYSGAEQAVNTEADKLFKDFGQAKQMIADAKAKLNWPARMQAVILETGHRFILDAAHNPSGLVRVKQQLVEQGKFANDDDRLSLIFGTSPQQNLTSMLDEALSICSRFSSAEVFLTKPEGGRYPPVEPDELALFDWQNCRVHVHDDYRTVMEIIIKQEPAVVGNILSIGSLYLQGNILSYLGKDSTEELSLLPKQSN